MTAAPTHPKGPLYTSIVSTNAETLDGLQAYLSGAGIASHCTRAIGDVSRVAPPCAMATVIFPDEFDHNQVIALLKSLRRTRPRLLSLLVTRQPQRFFEAVKPDGRSLPPITLPKPSFGWDILDAIRAHAEQKAG